MVYIELSQEGREGPQAVPPLTLEYHSTPRERADESNPLKQISTVRPFNGGGGPAPNGGAGTQLTITEAPTSIDEDKEYTIKGKIEIVDWPGGVVKAATVKLSYNGTSLGTATTDILGIFIKTWTFNETGTFYVVAKFEGVDGQFNPSSDFVKIVVNEVTPPPGEGNAQLTEIDFPDTLSPGDIISGIIRVKNTGAKDTIRLQLIREWLGKTKTTNHSAELETGQVMEVTITDTMPEDEAIYTFKAQHKEGLFAFITDDTAAHIITREAPPGEEPPGNGNGNGNGNGDEDEQTAWEKITEAWAVLPGWQKGLIVGIPLIGAAVLARPLLKR